MSDAIRRALESIKSDAKAARVARVLPRDRRPREFMISIGLTPPGEEIVGPSDDPDDEDEIVGPSD